MAKRELVSKGGDFPPTVKFQEPGQKFVGVLDSVRDGNFGKEYQFKIVDGDAFIGRPNGTKGSDGKNVYAAVDVKVGDAVRLESSKQIGIKLEQAVIGEKISIEFLEWKPTGKGKNFKDFRIEVVE